MGRQPGYTHTPESREKMKLRATGRKHTPETKARIRQAALAREARYRKEAPFKLMTGFRHHKAREEYLRWMSDVVTWLNGQPGLTDEWHPHWWGWNDNQGGRIRLWKEWKGNAKWWHTGYSFEGNSVRDIALLFKLTWA